jgi:hypothetical protein
MKSWTAIRTALAVFVLAIAGCATQGGPPGTGWVTLLDGTEKTFRDNWISTGAAPANWRVENGAVVADKGGKGSGMLMTKQSYKDFQIWAEFWAEDTTNSGIFIRISDPKSIGSKTSYEVNIYDQRPDPTYGTGAIVDVAKVSPMPKAAGKWNTFLITAKGPEMIVEMNGVETSRGTNARHPAGPFSLQFGGGTSGAIKWRKVMVRPL